MASARLCQKCACLLRGRKPLANTALSVTASGVVRDRREWYFNVYRFSHSVSAEKQGQQSLLKGSEVIPYKPSDPHWASTKQTVPDNQPPLDDLDGALPLSPFEEISDEEAVEIVALPPLPPTSTSLREYVTHSETLRKLVQLGVDLWKLEQRPNVGSMLLRLNFQQDVQGRLLFLKDVGMEDSQLGPLITRNPFILTESLENLQARVSYLKSKRFSTDAVCNMVSKAPYLLNFSIQRLDNRLGFFQKQLGLSPHKTRDIVTRLPRLLCGSLEPVKETLKVLELELGFRPNEIQHIVTRIPKVLTANKKRLTETFDYVHNTMGISHSLIVRFPQVLNTRLLHIKERHQFLQYLGKAQYDPLQSGYVSLDRLVSLPTAVFCSDIALTTLEDFEQFQKTL